MLFKWARRAGIWALWAAVSAVTPVYGNTILYTFQFQTDAVGQPVPTGGFGYDAVTGLFTNFIVVHDGVSYDFTPALNRMNGRSALPFELGYLGSNLIDGYGPLGPELSHWYAGTGGFYGFEWRTPAQDFLTFDLRVDSPGWAPKILTLPGAYAGTWRTAITADPVPEPAMSGMLLTALAAGAATFRRKHRT